MTTFNLKELLDTLLRDAGALYSLGEQLRAGETPNRPSPRQIREQLEPIAARWRQLASPTDDRPIWVVAEYAKSRGVAALEELAAELRVFERTGGFGSAAELEPDSVGIVLQLLAHRIDDPLAAIIADRSTPFEQLPALPGFRRADDDTDDAGRTC